MRFNENASQDIVRQLIRSITFSTTGSTSTAKRTISVFLRDHSGATDEAFMDVNVTP